MPKPHIGSKAISIRYSVRLGLVLLAALLVEALVTLWPSGLAITGHEGDLMHMLDASLRMVDGEMPHLDFMTPIGILGFAPVAYWIWAGFMVGKATLLANMSMAVFMLPAIWWVGASRLSFGQALFFGLGMIALLTSLVFGGAVPTISLSMYYNRWAWAVTFLVLMVVLLPARRDLAENLVSPLLVGSGMAALAMLKMTFFVPLMPVVILLMLARKQFRLLLKSLTIGLMVGLALLAWLGLDFFIAYFENLLVLTGESSGRSTPGASFSTVVASPASLPGSLVLLAGLLVFRKSGMMEQGLVFLLLAPVFAYITFQNWGNDPKWLFFIILYIWVNLPSADKKTLLGLPARQSLQVLMVVAITALFPSAISILTSPLRAAFSSTEGFVRVPLSPPGLGDIWLPEARMKNAIITQPMQGMPAPVPLVEPLVIDGIGFPECRGAATAIPIPLAMAKEVAGLEFTRDRPVLTADLLNSSWLLADVTRVKGAAPWYYGDNSGFEDAEFLLVPVCPLNVDMRRQMVSNFEEAGYTLKAAYSSELMGLFEIVKPAQPDRPLDR
ncbi:MAG: hypothetical protein L3J37_01555 [Rhodobacteraceae bacterium]|nr:hypothetical protein [Paracoccaceae bacterium]